MKSAASDLKIRIENPVPEALKTLGVDSWPIWSKAVSIFAWHYDEEETCYFLEGEVMVKTPFEEVTIQKGDLVTFPPGLSCTWRVLKPVRKHYRFGP